MQYAINMLHNNNILFVLVFFIVIIFLINKNITAYSYTKDTNYDNSNSYYGLIQIDISKVNVIHEVDKRFLSFSLDSYDLYLHWKRVDLT